MATKDSFQWSQIDCEEDVAFRIRVRLDNTFALWVLNTYRQIRLFLVNKAA